MPRRPLEHRRSLPRWHRGHRPGARRAGDCIGRPRRWRRRWNERRRGSESARGEGSSRPRFSPTVRRCEDRSRGPVLRCRPHRSCPTRASRPRPRGIPNGAWWRLPQPGATAPGATEAPAPAPCAARIRRRSGAHSLRPPPERRPLVACLPQWGAPTRARCAARALPARRSPRPGTGTPGHTPRGRWPRRSTRPIRCGEPPAHPPTRATSLPTSS